MSDIGGKKALADHLKDPSLFYLSPSAGAATSYTCTVGLPSDTQLVVDQISVKSK